MYKYVFNNWNNKKNIFDYKKKKIQEWFELKYGKTTGSDLSGFFF